MQKRAVIITASGFQDEEYVYPYYRLLEAGFVVDVSLKNKEVVYGKFGIPAKPTMGHEELKADNYDLVLLPGGFEAPDRVRLMPEVLEFVRDIDKQKKLVAAICHGPWILISAGIVKGRKMTAYWSIEADVRNAGADYMHKAPVVIDGNLITSPHYNNNGDFMKAVIAYFDE